MSRTQVVLAVAVAFFGVAAIEAAELSVGNLIIAPSETGTVEVSGSIAGEETFGVTILLEIVSRAGNVGTLEFTPAPPVDIVQLGDPWPGAGTFSPFDTDLTFSPVLNGSVDDNGTGLPAPVTYADLLTGCPVVASGDADGIWDVSLTTSAGNSSWEGLPTTRIDGTVTVTSAECTSNGDCDDGLFCNGAEICDTNGMCQPGVEPCVDQAHCDEEADVCICLANSECDDGLFCNGAEICDTNGVCQPGVEPCMDQAHCDEEADVCICLANSECDDGLFCNGAEICDTNGVCQPGVDPCPGQLCREADDLCVDCLAAGDCDDGLFCNGAETCDTNGVCQPGTDPCSGGPCDEEHDECITALHVDDNALPSGNGLSWQTAYVNLQEALAFASTNGAITEIWVAAGTYAPAGPGGDRLATFQLVNGVGHYGGYAGIGAPDPDERDPSLYVTTLSGDLNGDDGSGGDNSENSYHVVTASGTDATTLLNGFIITGGNADGSDPHDRGAGMYNYSSQIVVAQCIFTGNTAVFSGGGMLNDIGSAPAIVSCVFLENSAVVGGGMRNDFFSHPVVTNCTFTGNTSYSAAGLNSAFTCHPTVTNCILWGNTVTEGTVESAQIYGGVITINYCCVQGWTGDLGGVGNIGDDPLFVVAADPHLQSGSPCINAGDNEAPGLGAFDYEGDDRGQQCRVDMGADETPYFHNDCQPNGVADACDIAMGTSGDVNSNGVPDECDECVFNSDCYDGVFCNGMEICLVDVCTNGTPLDCDDGVGCTVDSCDEVNDICVNAASNGLCDNGDYCDGSETCDSLLDCQAGTPIDCADGVGCTVDSCDEINDVCVNAASNGLCDNGQFCDGVETCDPLLDCQAGSAPCGAGEWCDEGGDACIAYGDGDFEPDGDVDLADFSAFQMCFGQLAVGGCQPGNMIGDGVIDLDDYAIFRGLINGPG